MPTRTIQLAKFASALADVTGRAAVTLGPQGYGDSWAVTSANMRAATQDNEASGYLYLGPENPGNLQGATQAASTGDTASLTLTLHQAQFLTAVWIGADPGTECTLTLYGTRTIVGG